MIAAVRSRLPSGAFHLVVALLAYVLVVVLLRTVEPFRVTQLASMSYYLPAVAGLTVLTGLNGQISLGHGALMAVGCYTTAVLLDRHPEMSFLVVVLASVVTTGLVGALVGAAAARLHGPYLAGATLALAVGLPGLATYSTDFLGGDQGIKVRPPRPPAWFTDLTGQNTRAYVAYLGWALALLVLWLLSNLAASRYGRIWRAVRDDEVAASLAGINLGRARVLAFVVSAVCAGVGGSMLAIVSRLASPSTVTLVLSISLLTAIVVGGLGSLLGAVIGSAMLVFLATAISDQGRASGLSDATSAAVTPLVYGVVLVLVMISAPRGLTGTISTAVASRRERRRTQQDAGPHDPLPDPRAASQKEST